MAHTATADDLKRAVHHHPAHSGAGALERLFTFAFSGLVYPQIWEDPEVDMAAMELGPDHRVITIASGGNVNQQDGITVMCNLHTLDTARTYCDRVIGMSAGRVVFDGPPANLDDAIVREVYGVDGEDDEFDEAVTSTAIPFARPSASRPVPTHRDGASEPRRKAVNT